MQQSKKSFDVGWVMRVFGFAMCTVAFLAAVACSVVAAPPSQPAWLQSKIAVLVGLPVANPPRAILRTTYSGRTVYYVTPMCCDIPSELYDEAGRLLCYPDGGFAGGDGRCPGFTLSRDAATVWRDGRVAAKRATPLRE